MTDIAAARTFLLTHGRALEVRLAEFLLDGSTASGLAAIDALEAYRNPDGGFGHGLEPDALTPDSQPLAVDFAFDLLIDLADDQALTKRAQESASAALPFLASNTGSSGGVPIVLPSVADHPRAEHWGDGQFPPGLNPTAKLVGRARALGLDDPWLDRAAGFCRSALEDPASVGDAHTALCVFPFLDTEPDRQWATTRYERIATGLEDLAMFRASPDTPGYGLTPLDFAPTPDSPLRHLFDDKTIEAHLDVLATAQQDDGGWPLSWNPPGPGPVLAWRGAVTVHALHTLRAYGKLDE